MEETYAKLKDFYTGQGIPFREVEHAPGASAEEYHQALGCRYEQQLKCLLVKVYADTESFVMVTVPANKRVDFDKLKELFRAKKVRGATLDELSKIAGCVYGEVPAAGKIFGIRLVMDRDFLNETDIYMNAGIVTKSFIVNPKDLVALEGPLLI